MANTTGLTSGYTYAFGDLFIKNITFKFSYPIRYTYSQQFLTTKIPQKANFTFNLSNSYSNQFDVNFYKINTTLNTSNNYYMPFTYLSWTYNPIAYYTLNFNTYVNNQLWTTASKIQYQGKNYTANNGYITLSNILEDTKIPFVVWYNINNKWYSTQNYVITSIFNPCHPILTFNFNIYTNIYVNGTTTSNTTCSGVCGSSSGSSSSGSSGSSSSSNNSNSTGILPVLTKTTNTALGTSYLNLGIFSFVFTADFLYLAIALIIFGISEYYVKNSKFGVM
ncbi:MAG: hypothetical protein ACP5M8_08125, partial [Caldisphaera sp.]